MASTTTYLPTRPFRPIKTSREFLKPLPLWMTAYFGLTIFYGVFEHPSRVLVFGIANTITQCLLDLVIVYWALRTDDSAFKSAFNRRLFIFGFGSASIADAIYGTAVNVLGFTDTRGTVVELLYNIPFNFFLTSMGILLTRLVQDRMPARIARTVVALMPAGLLLLYFYSITGGKGASLQTYLMTGWSLLFEPAIILGAGVFFLFGTTISAQLVGSGLLIICSVNFFLQYLEFSGRLESSMPFEAFWVSGQLSVVVALLYSRTERGRGGSSEAKLFEFRFGNMRARFISTLVFLIAGLHFCWQLFFVSFHAENGITRIFLSVIFLSLASTPLALLFKSLFIKPVLRILEIIYRSETRMGNTPYVDSDLRLATSAIVQRILEAETSRMRSDATAELATKIAHDIRSPLTSLNCLLLSQDLQTVPDSVKNIMSSAILRIKDIADTLLDQNQPAPVGHAALSEYSEPLSSQDIGELLQVIILEKQSEYTLQNIGLRLEMDDPARGHFAFVQPGEFKRVLSNLINNAAEASPPNSNVRIGVRLEDGKLTVFVADRGHGIPDPILKRLGEKGLSHKPGGHGLGVFHAERSIVRWSSRLQFESETGVGTTASFALPVVVA